MKKVILVLSLLVSIVGAEQFDSSKRKILANAIQVAGYVCNDAHSANRAVWNDVITVYCDNYSTSYKIFQVGGRWKVEPK